LRQWVPLGWMRHLCTDRRSACGTCRRLEVDVWSRPYRDTQQLLSSGSEGVCGTGEWLLHLGSLLGMDVARQGVMAGRAWVWLSATTVSTTGAELAAAVVNPTESSIDYGALGSFERWNEEAWIRVGSWVTSLDHWGGFPTIAPEGQGVAIPAIGISAPAHGIGAVEYFSLPPLPEGVYRVSHSAAAFGIIRVIADAPTDVPHFSTPI
jgi:hypothetical protein